MDPLGKDIRDFLASFERHQVRFIVVGGFAVAVHGVPRYTKDIDLWVEPSPENARRIVAAIEEFGFASLGLAARDFEEPDMVIQLGYEPNRKRRITTKIGALEIPVIDRESLITNKRASGRPQDLADVEELSR